jgi:Lamin Tail Domain
VAILINEFLPNPAGSDANEWIELYNNGASAVNMEGWRIETVSGKKTFLSGTILPGGYKVFYKKDYKFTLRNIDENVTLYDAHGVVVDRAGFSGQAISGKSYSRQTPLEASSPLTGQANGTYIVTDPTPGAKNIQTSALSLINHPFPYDQPISPPAISTGVVILLGVGAGVLCAGVSLYIVKNLHDDISHLFFGKDEKIGGESGEEDFSF